MEPPQPAWKGKADRRVLLGGDNYAAKLPRTTHKPLGFTSGQVLKAMNDRHMYFSTPYGTDEKRKSTQLGWIHEPRPPPPRHTMGLGCLQYIRTMQNACLRTVVCYVVSDKTGLCGAGASINISPATACALLAPTLWLARPKLEWRSAVGGFQVGKTLQLSQTGGPCEWPLTIRSLGLSAPSSHEHAPQMSPMSQSRCRFASAFLHLSLKNTPKHHLRPFPPTPTAAATVSEPPPPAPQPSPQPFHEALAALRPSPPGLATRIKTWHV